MAGTPEPTAAARCSECGWNHSQPSSLPLGAIAWARLVGLVCLVALAWWMWPAAAPRPSRSVTEVPRVLQPCLSLEDVRAVANGSADPATAAALASHLRQLCDEGERRFDSDEQILAFGFVPAPRETVDWSGFGWPTYWYWHAEARCYLDACRKTEPHLYQSADPLQFQNQIQSDGELDPWVVLKSARSWDVDVGSIAYRPPPEENAGRNFTTSLQLDQLGLPIGLTWIAWWLAGAIARRRGAPAGRVRAVRRVALLGSLIAWCAIGYFGREPDRVELSRGWGMAANGWSEVAPLAYSLDETRAQLGSAAGIAQLAATIVEIAPRPKGAAPSPLYVAGVVGAVSNRSVQSIGLGERGRLFLIARTGDEAPKGLREPRMSGTRAQWDKGAIAIRTRPAVATDPETRIRIAPGPILWLVMGIAACCYVPAAIQRFFRRRIAARRLRRSKCPRCGYVLTANSHSRTASA